jgi:hypothetical protein
VLRWQVLVGRWAADWKCSGLNATTLGALAFAFGIAVARVGFGAIPESAAFAGTGEFSIWSVVTGFEVAVWAICWMAARSVRVEVDTQLPRAAAWPFVVVIAGLIVAARTALFFYPTIDIPLYGMRARQIVLQLVAILAAAPALFGIWRVQAWLRRADSRAALSPVTDLPVGPTVSRVLLVRAALHRLLLILSVMIGAVVFATGALRSAYLAGGLATDGFPPTSVLLFGALLTAALALLFIPVYADLRDFQRRLRERLCPVPMAGLPDEAWHVERERLTVLLRLDSGLVDTLRAATLVLGPFATALVTLFVPAGR